MLQTISSFAVLGAAFVGLWLIPKYIERRVTEAARGTVDIAVGKALAEHGQTLAKDRERYSRDYALFAEKRNEIYAQTFALLEYARGHFSPYFASRISSHPDYSRFNEAEAKSFLAGLELLSERERKETGELIDWNLGDAKKELAKLYDRDALRRATRKYVEFKNATIVSALYFDQPIEAGLDTVLGDMSKISIMADLMIDGAPFKMGERIEAYEKLTASTAVLREMMRNEMRAGFATPFVEPRPA